MALKISGTTVIDDSLVAVLDETYVKTMTVSQYVPNATGETNGYTITSSTVIDRFPFSTPFTTATDVGNLSQGKTSVASQSSSTHGHASGGITTTPPFTVINTIDRFPFSTPFTTATDIGDLSRNTYAGQGHSSDSHGYTSGGYDQFTASTVTIDSFPFSTPFVTAAFVGNLSVALSGAASSSSQTHGYSSSGSYMDKFPFSSPFGVASDVGNLSVFRLGIGSGQSSSTNGYISGGFTPGGYYSPPSANNRIDRFPFSTPFTTATNVGSLSQARYFNAGESSTVDGYTSGGNGGSGIGFVNRIDKFPFSTPFTNATDIGDLSQAPTVVNISGQQD